MKKCNRFLLWICFTVPKNDLKWISNIAKYNKYEGKCLLRKVGLEGKTGKLLRRNPVMS